MKKLLLTLAVLVGCGQSPTSLTPTPEEWYALRPTDTLGVTITASMTWGGAGGGAKEVLQIRNKRTHRAAAGRIVALMEYHIGDRLVLVDTIVSDSYTIKRLRGLGEFSHEFRFPSTQWVRRTVCPVSYPRKQPALCRVDIFHG